QQLAAIKQESDRLMERQYATWRNLRGLLREAGIVVVDEKELTRQDRAWLTDRFDEEILPILTPVAIDPAHPFPFIPNFGFGLVLKMHRARNDEPVHAILRLPQQTDRFIRLPGDAHRFLPLEQA